MEEELIIKVNKLNKYISNQHDINTYKDLITKGCNNKDYYSEQIKIKNKERTEIECAINDIANSNERNILIKKYMLNKTFKEIADDIGYCEQQIKRIHKKALYNICI